MTEKQVTNKSHRRLLKGLGISIGILTILLLLAFFGLKKNINTTGMQQADFEHFTILYQEAEDQTIADLNAALESIHAEYADDYGLPDDDKTEVVIYSNAADFKNAYLGVILGWMYRDVDWIVGGAYQDMLVILSPEHAGSMHSYEDMMAVVRHELIHVYNFHLNEMPNMILDEGLAELLSGLGETEQRPDQPVPSFDEINSWNFEEFGNRGGYYYSYAFCAYLVNEIGLADVLKIVQTEDFEGISGKSFEILYHEWAVSNPQ